MRDERKDAVEDYHISGFNNWYKFTIFLKNDWDTTGKGGGRIGKNEELHFGAVVIKIPMKPSGRNSKRATHGIMRYTHTQRRKWDQDKQSGSFTHSWFSRAQKWKTSGKTAQIQKGAQSHFLNHRGRLSKGDLWGKKPEECINEEAAKREKHFKKERVGNSVSCPWKTK